MSKRINYIISEFKDQYLMDTCLSAQDTYVEWVKYFYGDLLQQNHK